jgi:hypothetical protein
MPPPGGPLRKFRRTVCYVFIFNPYEYLLVKISFVKKTLGDVTQGPRDQIKPGTKGSSLLSAPMT